MSVENKKARQPEHKRTSWKTGSVLLSRGLTVFLFFISGSRSAPGFLGHGGTGQIELGGALALHGNLLDRAAVAFGLRDSEGAAPAAAGADARKNRRTL